MSTTTGAPATSASVAAASGGFGSLMRYMSLLIEIASELSAAQAAIDNDQAVDLPSIPTYIRGKHVKVTMTVSPAG